jgi:hypothetical protein
MFILLYLFGVFSYVPCRCRSGPGLQQKTEQVIEILCITVPILGKL